VLLFGFSKRLWAIYWYGAENTFVLFQGPGVAIVSALALVVTLSMTASERPLIPAEIRQRFARSRDRTAGAAGNAEPSVGRSLELAGGGSSDGIVAGHVDRVREIVGGSRLSPESDRLSDLTRRGAAFLTVIGILAIVAGMAIPANFLVVDESTASSDAAVQIEDYTVEYVEDVPNGLVTGIGIEALEDDEGLESSG